MATLGKDLIRIDKSFFEFAVLFSDDKYEIEDRAYTLGELTTAFLNYHASEFFAAIEKYDAETIEKTLRAMPLYGDMARDKELNFSVEDCAVVADDIKLIQTRYA